MKQRFLNQKLAKRGTHRARELRAKLSAAAPRGRRAARPAPRRRG